LELKTFTCKKLDQQALLLLMDVAGVISECGFLKEDTISCMQGNIYFSKIATMKINVFATFILIHYFVPS
jgi:hypothetical protein